jgi:D-aminoacyl-tRNA deacylase
MRAVVQRVSKASVKIDAKICGEIHTGLVVLIAVSETDSGETIKWMCNKIVNLRVFPDEDNKMNLSVQDVNGEILLISNFTLYGDTRKGFRPSFTDSAPPSVAEPLYNEMIQYLKKNYSVKIATGEFGAKMDIELINDGPVTLIIDK